MLAVIMDSVDNSSSAGIDSECLSLSRLCAGVSLDRSVVRIRRPNSTARLQSTRKVQRTRSTKVALENDLRLTL